MDTMPSFLCAEVIENMADNLIKENLSKNFAYFLQKQVLKLDLAAFRCYTMIEKWEFYEREVFVHDDSIHSGKS